MRRFARPLVAVGILILAVAVGWWWITYDDVIGYAYISVREAGACLVGDSDICRLARALCRGAHPIAIIDYRNAIFWLGVVVMSSGLFALERKRQ